MVDSAPRARTRAQIGHDHCMTNEPDAFTVSDAPAFVAAVTDLTGLHAAAATLAADATALAESLSTPADPAPGTVVPHALTAALAAAAALARETALQAGTAAESLAGTAERLAAVQGSTGGVDDGAAADVAAAGEDGRP